ncbi:MAG: hypothetical protein V2B18_05875 [Pseudomonadota bacterium]
MRNVQAARIGCTILVLVAALVGSAVAGPPPCPPVACQPMACPPPACGPVICSPPVCGPPCPPPACGPQRCGPGLLGSILEGACRVVTGLIAAPLKIVDQGLYGGDCGLRQCPPIPCAPPCPPPVCAPRTCGPMMPAYGAMPMAPPRMGPPPAGMSGRKNKPFAKSQDKSGLMAAGADSFAFGNQW